MNRKESKKRAVMTAVIMGFMVFAFMPLASADVKSFSVTPSTGIAGAVDSYNVLVTTDGVTSIHITIPAGFIAVTPMSGGKEIARVEFWNTSKGDYYGYATITSNSDYENKVDVYSEMQVGGDEFGYGPTPRDVNYNPGEFTSFEVKVNDGIAWANITLPTEKEEGWINITIDCESLDLLQDVHIAIKQFVRNPLTKGNYDFIADGETSTVTITEVEGRGIVYNNGLWYVDTTGNHVADQVFWFEPDGIPLIGNFGSEDTVVVKAPDGKYKWFVDTTGDHVADKVFVYGDAPPGSIPLVGDINQDGTDDVAVVSVDDGGNYKWSVDTDDDQDTDLTFRYGFEGAIPLVGDIDQDGKDDIAVVKAYDGNYRWFVDTNGEDGGYAADTKFWYGFAGAIPLVGDINWDGTDDIAVVGEYGGNYKWYVDINFDKFADQPYWFGFDPSIPLAGPISPAESG
jgi:hypothetical protein